MDSYKQWDKAKTFFDDLQKVMEKHKIESMAGAIFFDTNYVPFKQTGFELTDETDIIAEGVYILNIKIAELVQQGLTPTVRAKENNLPLIIGG